MHLVSIIEKIYVRIKRKIKKSKMAFRLSVSDTKSKYTEININIFYL